MGSTRSRISRSVFSGPGTGRRSEESAKRQTFQCGLLRSNCATLRSEQVPAFGRELPLCWKCQYERMGR